MTEGVSLDAKVRVGAEAIACMHVRTRTAEGATTERWLSPRVPGAEVKREGSLLGRELLVKITSFHAVP